MARTSATITVGADTRQLERDIQNALSRDFKFKGINEKAFTQPLGRITGAANEFQKSLDASNARVIAFGASAGLIYTVERAFTDLIRSTVEVQKSLTDINVILNTTTQGLAKFGGEVFNIAKNTGQSFQAVAQAATEFARQGLGVEETLKRTRDALVLTRLSGLDVVSSVEALTATVNSFNKVALDSTTVINKLANVDAAFAVSSADLANAISRVGSSAQDAGVSFDELLGIVTSVQQTTARGGAVIGNSLKTIFTRIQRTDVLDQLQALGLNVRDLEGNTLPALQILQELAGTFDQLADSQRAQVAESVGGVFQINVLKAALGDLGKEYSIYQRALKTSSTATDEAIKRNEALNETVSALFNRTVANVTQLGAAFGAGAFQPAIESTLKNINKVLEFINSQDTESVGGKLGEGILKGLSTFISGPGVVLITAVLGKLTLDLAKFASSGFKTLLGINQQAEARAQLQAKINQVLSQEPQLLAAINAKQINVLTVENQILKILREQNALRTQAAALSSTISGSLIRQGVGVKGGQITTKSSGFIPNYAMSEIYGALAGGYQPGKLKEMNISGEGRIIYNSAEKVKKFAGMSQPAIMPPQNSKAGKNYEDNFIKKNGFNPYASSGYIPNFITNAFSENVLVSEARQQFRFRRLINQGYQPLRGEEAERALLRSNEALFRNGTLTLEGGQVFVKSGSRGLITQQLREKEKSTALGRGGKEGAKFRKNYVLVYPSTVGGPSILTGGNTKDSGSYRFSAYPFPGGDTAVPDQLYKDATTSLIQNAKNYINTISTRPQVVQGANFENYVRGNLSRSAIEATVGQVFESAIKASLNRISTSEINTFDLNQNELYALSKRFKNTEELGRFSFGDLKNSLSEGNLDSFAEKIARTESKSTIKKRTKSAGFIPNFTALGEAIKREASAGIPMSKIRIGQDNRLMSKYNPLGVGVYNTEDEPNGIRQGISGQRSISAAKKAGAFYEGYVPNFATLFSAMQAEAGPIAIPATGEAKKAISGLIQSVINGQTSLEEANIKLNSVSKEFDLLDESTAKVRNSLQRADTVNKKLTKETDKLASQAGSIFGSRAANQELEKRAARGGRGGELAGAALARSQERRNAALGRLQGVGIGLSVGAPILAQTIASSRPGDRNAAAAAEGIGTFASFAGAGALFGPLGIAIGSTIGAIVGFKKALDTVNDESDKYAKKAQESADKLSRFTENVQKFLSLRTQIEGLISGQIKGTQGELDRSERESRLTLAKIFKESGPEITKEISTALQTGDEELLRDALGRAQVAKEAANSINSFTSSIVKLKRESGGKILSEDIRKSVESFGNVRTRSGKTIAEYIIEENLIKPLTDFQFSSQKGFRGATTITSEISKELERLTTLSRAAAPVVTPAGPVNPAIPLPKGFKSITELQAFASLPKREQLKYIESGSAQKALDAFSKGFDQFSNKLINAGEITQDEADDLSKSIGSILSGDANPTDKLKAVTEEMRRFGGSLDIAATVIDNARQSLFGFSQLSQNLRQLFVQGDGTESGNAKAAEQRAIAAATLRRANFTDLLKDPKIFADYKPDVILENLIRSTGVKISGGTQEQEKRISIFTKFTDEFKSELEILSSGARLTDEQLAKLEAGAERAGQEASFASENFSFLNKNISDGVLRQEAINEYKKIEADLTKKLNGNIDLLVPAAKNAAEELATIQKARLGQLFLEEKNQRLMQGAYGKIKTPGLFEGLDVEEMTKRTSSDYEKLIADLTNEGITSINANVFDEQAKILAKERLKALEKEQLSLVKTQGGLSTRQLSDAQARFRQLNASNTSLKEGFDTLNESITNANLREEAKNILEEKSRSLEIEYQGNLVKLKEATSAFIEVLTKRAQFLEGRVFADELKGAEERARTEKIREGKFEGTDVFDAFSDEMIYGPQDAMKDLNALGTDTARTLKSEFNNAFQSIIDGTQEAGDAFRTMALNISRRIQQLALEMTTNLAFNSLFSSFGGIPSMFKNPLSGSTGGLVYSNKIKGYSYGGKVTGGSGVRDDVPAMLSRGEYVIRKSAVNKYGDGFLNRLNNGGVVKRERGGMGAGDPKDYTRFQPVENYRNVGMIAPQGVGATPDFSSRDAMGGAFSADLLSDFYYDQFEYGVPVGGKFVFDPRLSAFGRYDESNPANQLTIAKLERALTLQGEVESYKQYLADLDQRNREEQARINQINQEQQDAYNKQKRNAFWGSLLQAGAAIGFGAFSQYGVPALKAAFQGGSQGWANWRGTAPSSYNPSAYGYSNFRTTPPTLRKGYAKGGSIYKDDIPALLMDGEYVIRKDAVNLYGKDFFDKLNSGRINKYADGGMVSNGYSNSENFANSERESTQASNNTNNITITVNVNQANGTTTESKNQNQSSDSKTPDEKRQEEIERNKLLSERIKSEVVKVINQEQRPGGLLSSTKYKMNT